jgi:hypothetical protein
MQGIENVSFAGLTARMGPASLQLYAADFLSAAKAVAARSAFCSSPNTLDLSYLGIESQSLFVS